MFFSFLTNITLTYLDNETILAARLSQERSVADSWEVGTPGIGRSGKWSSFSERFSMILISNSSILYIYIIIIVNYYYYLLLLIIVMNYYYELSL